MTNTVQIPNDQMIFSVQELKDKGFSYYKINQMVDKGILIKLNKKYYENVNFEGEESDFYYAYAFVPGGVVCLLSIKNPNIYPYNVFHRKDIDPFIFAPITVLYGNNGSGKSTILNIIANKLMLTGKEYATSNSFGIVDYCGKFSSECQFSYGEDEFGNVFRRFPENSRFIKSEDILYEIKKIQQRQILSDGMEYDYIKNGHSKKEAEDYFQTQEGRNQIEYIEFAQEKYSNGETAMQFFEEYLLPDALYLLDEPEVSLSPANQVLLAKEINKLARLLSCQFIIATHSPFMLGTLNAKIYNIDKDDYSICKWYELENVRYFYDFFKKHEKEFE